MIFRPRKCTNKYNIDIIAFAEYKVIAEQNLVSATNKFNSLNSLKTLNLGNYQQLGGDNNLLGTQNQAEYDLDIINFETDIISLGTEYNTIINPTEEIIEEPTEPEINLEELTTLIDSAIENTPVDTRLSEILSEISTLEIEITELQNTISENNTESIQGRIDTINARLIALREELRIEAEKTRLLLLEKDTIALNDINNTDILLADTLNAIDNLGGFFINSALAETLSPSQALSSAINKIQQLNNQISNLVKSGSLADLERIEDKEGKLGVLIHDLEGDVVKLQSTRDSKLSTLNSIIRNKDGFEEQVTQYRQEAEAVIFPNNSNFSLQTGNYPEYNGVVVEEETYKGKTMQGILTLTNGTTFPGKIKMYVDGVRVGGEFTVNSWNHRYNYKDPLSDLFKASLRFQYSAEKVQELESEIPQATTEYNTAEYNYSTQNNLLNSKTNEYNSLQTEFTSRYQTTSPIPGSTYQNTFDGIVTSLYNEVDLKTRILKLVESNRDNLQNGINENNSLVEELTIEQEALVISEGTNENTNVYLNVLKNQLIILEGEKQVAISSLDTSSTTRGIEDLFIKNRQHYLSSWSNNIPTNEEFDNSPKLLVKSIDEYIKSYNIFISDSNEYPKFIRGDFEITNTYNETYYTKIHIVKNKEEEGVKIKDLEIEIIRLQSQTIDSLKKNLEVPGSKKILKYNIEFLDSEIPDFTDSFEIYLDQGKEIFTYNKRIKENEDSHIGAVNWILPLISNKTDKTKVYLERHYIGEDYDIKSNKSFSFWNKETGEINPSFSSLDSNKYAVGFDVIINGNKVNTSEIGNFFVGLNGYRSGMSLEGVESISNKVELGKTILFNSSGDELYDRRFYKAGHAYGKIEKQGFSDKGLLFARKILILWAQSNLSYPDFKKKYLDLKSNKTTV